MNTIDIRKHSAVRGIFKELVRLNHSFTFEPTPEEGGCKATGLFRIYNLPCAVLIKIYLEKGKPPIVHLNGEDVSDRSIKELKGLIDSAKIPTFSEFVNRTFQNTGIRMFPETQDNGNYIEPVKSTDTGHKSDLIGALIDGYLSNPEASDHSLKYIISRAFLIEQRDWDKHMMGADTAEFKYTKGQDVKLLPSGKVCTFVHYIDKHKEYCPYCVIRAYGSPSGLMTVKLTDIEPWYATPTLFKGDERVKSIVSGRAGKITGRPFRGDKDFIWVLFDDSEAPEEVHVENLEKLPEEKKLPDWKKGDILILRGTDKQFTFSEFNVSGDKAIVERDGVRSWQRIDELEQIYTDSVRESMEKKLPDWVKGDILRRKGSDEEWVFLEFGGKGMSRAHVTFKTNELTRRWYLIDELELYTAKRSEPEYFNVKKWGGAKQIVSDDKDPKKAGAERKNDGKLEWSLVDFDALEPMVLGLMKGAQKYSRDNWKKGLHTSKIMESLMRHYTAFMRGELIDAETGVPHIGLLMCNAMFFSWTVKNKPELNDL